MYKTKFAYSIVKFIYQRRNMSRKRIVATDKWGPTGQHPDHFIHVKHRKHCFNQCGIFLLNFNMCFKLECTGKGLTTFTKLKKKSVDKNEWCFFKVEIWVYWLGKSGSTRQLNQPCGKVSKKYMTFSQVKFISTCQLTVWFCQLIVCIFNFGE